jgi:hypothetical protein
MGLGRRSAPSAPPIPTPPLPPSAYGIAVPGAPAVADAHYTPAPPPPPRTATPPPYEPPPPAIQYASAAPPSEASAARFGGYAGPADPFAAPPTSQFGAPAANAFGTPPTAYGSPTWSTQPNKKQGSRLWAKVLAGVIVGLFGLGFLGHAYLAATKHHLVDGMPTTISTATLDTGASAQAVEARVLASIQQSPDMHAAKKFQVGIYHDGGTLVVADMGEIPANSPAFRNSLVNSFSSSETGMAFTSVPSGVKGGTESCGSSATATMCLWADNGTFGVLGLNTVDLAAAEQFLTAFRNQVEH